MFTSMTPEFTRGALLIVNSIEMLAVIYGVLAIINFLNGVKTDAATQLKASQDQTAVLKDLVAAQQTTLTFLQNSQPGV
jgi:hypothetical protein